MLKIQNVGFLVFLLQFCWIIGLDWILLVQFNPKNPKKVEKWGFEVGFSWMFNHPSNPKSRKKLTSYIQKILICY
jgi:hypothetical protein